MSRASKTILGLGFWLVLAALVGNGLLTYLNLRTIVENNASVDHTREVIVELAHTLSVLKDAETGQRGYLLTNKARYLEPYRAAVSELDRTVDRLTALTSDNPFQQARINDLRRVIVEKMAIIRQTVTLHDEKGLAAALEVVQTDRGKTLMDEARRVIAVMDAEESRLLGLRSAATEAATRRTLLSFFVTTGAALALLAVVSYFNRRSARHSERISEAVRVEQEWLSTTLTSIGDAVIASDIEGRVKFLNPIAETLTGWSQSEAMGKRVVEVFSILNEYTREPVEDPIGKVLREGAVVGLANHTVLIARDGTETAIDDSAAPIKDDAGHVVGAVLVFRDITERKRQEEAIAEQNRLVEFGRDIGIVLTETVGLQDMLTRCVEETVSHLDGAFARIWTVIETGDMLELQASAGMYTHIDGPHARVPIGQYKIGLIAQERQPHLTNSVIGDPRVPAQEWAEREGMVSFAGYPLVVDDRLVGVWAMFARHALSKAAVQKMASVARQIALGIERKQTEQRLYREREWLSTTLSSIGDAVIATDVEGRVKFLNPIAETLTGWSQREAMGRAVVEVFLILNDSTRQAIENPIGKVLREGAVVGLANHTILIARDGTETAIEESAAPIKDEGGEIIGVVMVFRDATVQRRHEKSLRASEAQFRQLADAMPQIVWTARPDGFLDYYNERWYEFTGLPRGEGGDRSWKPILHPDDVSKCHEVWYRSVRTGEPYQFEYRFLDRETNRYRWHLGRALPARDDSGTIVKWFGSCTDIDDRKRAEEALRESHLMIADILDHMTDACMGLDREWRLTYVNTRWQESFGKSAEDVLGKVIWDLFPGLVDTTVEANYRKVLEERIGVSFEVFSPLIKRWISVRAYPTEQGMASFIQDIDDRKRADDELRVAKEEAEFASQAKDRFLAVLSHELRTPLNPVLLATTAMLEHPTPPDEIRPALEMIRQNVNLQARLIDDLLDVMRIVRGKMPLHWGIVDCHEQIHRAIEICKSEIQDKNLHLRLNLRAEHRHANADPARLQQVLWNLIKNAVKFTPEGGTVTIASWNEEGPNDEVRAIVIEVADTGIGIEPDVLPKIFDPFQQGETTITRRFGGLGLGLAISRGIIEAHGGTLSAESQGQEQGATFRVELTTMTEPRQDHPDDRPQENAPEPPPPAKSCRILVVEDEPATLQLMARLLGRLGHEVKTASSIDAALDVLNNGGFDMLISDIGLPDGSGLDLIRKIVAENGPVPSIALTGYGMDEDIRRSRDAGFTMHMTKPIDFSKLEAMIERITV